MLGFIFIYGLILLIEMMNKSQVSWNKNTYWRELYKDTESETFDSGDPQLYLYWKGMDRLASNNFSANDHVITRFEHVQLDNKYNEKSVSSLTNFEWDNSFGELEDLGRTEAGNFCPNMTGKDLKGNSLHPNETRYYRFIFLTWKSSSNNNECLKNEDSEKLLDGSPISIYMKNNYVDFNDFDNPIKNYTALLDNYKFQIGRVKILKIRVALNEIILEDSLFNIFSKPKIKRFKTIEDTYEADDKEVSETRGKVVIRVELDSKVHQYRRTVQNFLDVTGKLGGIFEILEIILGSLIGFYASNRFKKNLFQEIVYCQREIKELEKIFNKLKDTSGENIRSQEEKNEDEKIEENLQEDFEGGSKINFSRVKPYKCLPEGTASK